jgi:hypothetical protein
MDWNREDTPPNEEMIFFRLDEYETYLGYVRLDGMVCCDCLDDVVGESIVEWLSVDRVIAMLDEFQAISEERAEARGVARRLAHAYQNDSRPMLRWVETALGYPVKE